MQASFGHITVLVVVLNAIGLGTLMIGIATFVRKPPQKGLKISWILVAWCALHVYLHIMLWWRFYGMTLAESFNFFNYLFMLSGPMVLMFGSALLLPEEDKGTIDMPGHLDFVQRRLFAFEALFWIWGLLVGPLIAGQWFSVWPLWVIMILVSVAMMFAKTPTSRVGLTAAAWGVQIVFVATEALTLRTPPPA